MKKSLLIAFAVIYPGWIFCQCTPSNSTIPGVTPSIQDNLPYAYTGNPYSTIIQVRTPLDTTVNGTYAKLTEVKITGIVNLPSGFSYTCSPSNCTLGPLQNGCMELTGNPTLAHAGTYILDIDITVKGKLYGVIPVTQQTKLSDYKIKVFGPPVANFYADKNNACINEPITFSDNSTNEPTSYLWTFTGGTPATSTLENPVVTYPASGNYSVKLKVTSPAGQNTLLKTSLIHINSGPSANLVSYTPDTICAGDSTLIECTPINGSTYQWYKNNAIINGAINPEYYAKSNGAYAVEVTKVSTRCASLSSAKNIKTINLSTSVTPVGPSAVCSPAKVTLMAPNKSNLNYTWYRNNQVISGANTSVLVTGNSGKYKVLVTNQRGCSKVSNISPVSVYSKPGSAIVPLGPTTFCQDENVTLKNTTANSNATFKWFRNNSVINGATGKTYVANLKGNYTSMVITQHGCSKVSQIQKITINCRFGDITNHEQALQVAVSPNPAAEHSIIAFENQQPQFVTLSLYDAIGKLQSVISKGFYNAGEHEIYINTENYINGIYFIKIETDRENKTLKLIVRN